MSTAGLKRKRRAKKVEMGFELNPPRCLNCQHFTPPRYGVPGKPGTWREPGCSLGGFMVLQWSICDQWRGINGETLETEHERKD